MEQETSTLPTVAVQGRGKGGLCKSAIAPMKGRWSGVVAVAMIKMVKK